MTSQPAPAMMPQHAEPKPRMSITGWVAIALGTIVTAYLMYYNVAQAHDGHGGDHATHMPRLWGLGILPFVGILFGREVGVAQVALGLSVAYAFVFASCLYFTVRPEPA